MFVRYLSPALQPGRKLVAAFLVAALAALAGGAALSGRVLATTDPCSFANVNPIPCENQKTGTDPSIWDLNDAGSPSLQGFATDISVNVGGTVSFKIDTTFSSYNITIYRLGYYQGNGARQITPTPLPATAQKQPPCLTNGPTGLVDCGNWAVSATWAVPTTAVSGIYVAKLKTSSGAASHIVFVVRNDASTSDVLLKTNDTTWEAYNDYGGSSVYYGTAPTSNGRAYKVSYNRPFSNRSEAGGYGTSNWVFYGEYPMLRFLESNGYNVSYTSSIDAERSPNLLKNHKVLLSSGHDEYWSAGERTAVQAARDAGVNLALFTGNDLFWKTRWETSIDSSHTAFRTLVTYKETLDNAAIDPADPSTWTGTWRDPRFSPPADGGRPENALLGPIFMVNRGSGAPVISSAFSKLRFWRNTPVAALTGSQTVVLGQDIIGYEWDADVDNGFRPPGLMDLWSTTLPVTDLLQDYGSTYLPGTATHSPTLYRAPGGGLVFAAGTVQWAWGLDTNHDTQPDTGPADPSAVMQQATVNLLADMGAQPTTLDSSLVAASPTSDVTPPSSHVGFPAPNAHVASGSTVTVTGTASDTGGVVAGVEVSLNGGTTWHKASGTTSWSYTWTPGAPGATTIKSRSADDSGNLETSSATVAVTVDPHACPCSLFPSTAVPAVAATQDAAAYELGVKFTTDTPGYVNGVRFFKGTGNTGTHTGSLWTSAGTLLGNGTFTNETSGGWQTLTFTSPVAVQANTVYVVSYHTTTGFYSSNTGYFGSQYDSWPLHAPAGANGVYAAGGSQFPNLSFASTNYWVDVVFNSQFVDTVNPAVAVSSPASGATGASFTAPVQASFNKNVVQSSIQFTLTGPNSTNVPGALSYDSTTYTASFQPTSALSMGTGYTAKVSGAVDTSGNPMTAPYSWSFTTLSCPCTLFPATSTPATPAVSDPGPVELGLKFRADLNGFVNGIRFYKGSTNTGTHLGSVWTSGGALLASATFTSETATGWQQVLFSSPVAVTAGTLYVASYHTNAGNYAATGAAFNTQVDGGPLHAPTSASVTGNGVYAYGSTQFPTQSFQATNYWVDVVYNTTFVDTVAPVVTATSPTSGATVVDPASSVTATFSKSVVASSIQFTLTGPNSSQVAGATTYTDTNHTATFKPSAALAGGTVYTATVSGARDASGNVMTTFTWSFTTAECCSLFLPSEVPGTVMANDPSAVEVGMKFTADVSGHVTGVRFYKGSSNTGTHTGSLWTTSGQLLATATFANETASGWQQVKFSQPVAVTAGTVYVVSYHTNTGFYSADGNYFAAAVNRAPLHAVANGTSPNGVYAYGSTSTFPNGSYNATNYWVDVIFSTS
jgi:hypothetical protein